MNFFARKIRRVAQAVRRFPRNLWEPPVAVLLYHRVATPDNDPCQLAVSPENFRRQMAYLAENFPIIRFRDNPDFHRFSIAVTFDDGYVDNLENALPILCEFGVPATFFVSSGYLDGHAGYPWDGGQTPVPAHSRPMNQTELRELDANALADIGSHTRTHRRLSELTPNEQEAEIAGGHRDLEEVLGHKIETFSIPFGNYSDFNTETVTICRRAGFHRVAANFPGQWHSDSDLMLLPRHIIRNYNEHGLKSRRWRFRFL